MVSESILAWIIGDSPSLDDHKRLADYFLGPLYLGSLIYVVFWRMLMTIGKKGNAFQQRLLVHCFRVYLSVAVVIISRLILQVLIAVSTLDDLRVLHVFVTEFLDITPTFFLTTSYSLLCYLLYFINLDISLAARPHRDQKLSRARLFLFGLNIFAYVLLFLLVIFCFDINTSDTLPWNVSRAYMTTRLAAGIVTLVTAGIIARLFHSLITLINDICVHSGRTISTTRLSVLFGVSIGTLMVRSILYFTKAVLLMYGQSMERNIYNGDPWKINNVSPLLILYLIVYYILLELAPLTFLAYILKPPRPVSEQLNLLPPEPDNPIPVESITTETSAII
eukprot:TRINITY_DN11618_c0_g1_i4.p1 TRINITY_DN11618_c0_g1~~TRINITY_DN11618_c0_g1_i4.p1  ORF type:complete len:336 (+),score=16.19 TRINITY_DN11618_c0_g1_i4:122-1129(+)